MKFIDDDDSGPEPTVTYADLQIRLAVMERLVQVMLIMQLRDAKDTQATIERLRKASQSPKDRPTFALNLERYLADLEVIAHQKPNKSAGA